MSERKIAFWFIALLSLLVIFPFMGEALFYSKGEPREAIVAYTMLESGNWILPLNYGSDIAYKPPFLYWMIAIFSSITGEVTEFTSRLPSAIYFLAMQLVFFVFVARKRDVKTAVLTSILLLTSFEVHRAAVNCRLDMVQVSLIVISLCLLFRWDEKGSHGIPWVAVLLMACASLTKGPVGTIFPCMVTGVYQLIRGRSFGKAFFSLAGIGLLSLIPLAVWFWAAYQQGGEPFINLMLEENTGRFFSKMSYGSHENPIWYNFLTLIWGWIPWTLVLLISLFGLNWKTMRLPGTGNWLKRIRQMWNAFRKQAPWQLFSWLAILLIFIFYCIPESKRSVYLLPIYPFMAMFIAEYLLAQVQRGTKIFKICASIFASLSLLLTFVFVAVRLGVIPESIWGTGRHAAENISYMKALEHVSLSFPQWLLVLLPVVAAVCLFILLKKRVGAYSLLYGIAGCMLCVFVSLDSIYQPTVLTVKSDKPLAEKVQEIVPEGPVYSYSSVNFYGVNFYLGDRMRHIENEMDRVSSGYILIAEDVEEEALSFLEKKYSLEQVFRTEKRSCDTRCKVAFYKFNEK